MGKLFETLETNSEMSQIWPSAFASPQNMLRMLTVLPTEPLHHLQIHDFLGNTFKKQNIRTLKWGMIQQGVPHSLDNQEINQYYIYEVLAQCPNRTEPLFKILSKEKNSILTWNWIWVPCRSVGHLLSSDLAHLIINPSSAHFQSDFHPNLKNIQRYFGYFHISRQQDFYTFSKF